MMKIVILTILLLNPLLSSAQENTEDHDLTEAATEARELREMGMEMKLCLVIFGGVMTTPMDEDSFEEIRTAYEDSDCAKRLGMPFESIIERRDG